MARGQTIEFTVKGPRGSGKTTFLINLLKCAGFNVPKEVNFVEGFTLNLSNGSAVSIKEIPASK